MVDFTNSSYIKFLYKDGSVLEFHEKYQPEKYERFDKNPQIINVDRLKDIPFDYDGEIAVPITFFDIYDPELFEIPYPYVLRDYIKGKIKYARVVIKLKFKEYIEKLNRGELI